jgi:hypothetical protein
MPDRMSESADVASYISKGWEKLYGGKLEFIANPDEMVRLALEHIDKKRAALGLPIYDAGRFGRSGDARMLEMEQSMDPYGSLEERSEALYGAMVGKE